MRTVASETTQADPDRGTIGTERPRDVKLVSRIRTLSMLSLRSQLGWGSNPRIGSQMQYSYRIPYHHPRTRIVGVAILHTAAEAVAERARLEALGYTLDDTLLPIGERPHLPTIPRLGDL